MTKKSKKSNLPKVDPYIEGLISKLVDRLVGLEKKIDTIVRQTAGRPQEITGSPTVVSLPQPKHNRTLYEAICADCAKVCEVPFKPSEDRAVYCKDCFARRKSGMNKPFAKLTPVSLPPKTPSKLSVPYTPPPAPAPAAKKSKKSKPSKPAKKSKKK